MKIKLNQILRYKIKKKKKTYDNQKNKCQI